jgi:acyl carrier protein phosphodiesterase
VAGVENALSRIEARMKSRIGRQINLVGAVNILDREYINLERDFCSFFGELQDYLKQYQDDFSSESIEN